MTTFRTNFAAALPVIASVSILAVTVGKKTGNCGWFTPDGTISTSFSQSFTSSRASIRAFFALVFDPPLCVTGPP